LLEWLAFLYRYIPVGLLERAPQRIGEKCPPAIARDELEQLMLSPDARDWVRISEMLLGPVESDYRFVPKHKSSQAYEAAEEAGGSSASVGVGAKRAHVEAEGDDDGEAEG